jgi:hypothetical protein
MCRLLRQVLAAEGERTIELARLAVFVGERGEVASGVLVELLLQLVDPGGASQFSPL